MTACQISLCEMQGQLFIQSAEKGYSSEKFIKTFMTSDIAADLDSDFNHLQWAGKEYILERMEMEFGDILDEKGEVYDREALFWMGYVYRYWHFYKGESSKKIFRQADARKMRIVYLPYHTMSVEFAIDRLKNSDY